MRLLIYETIPYIHVKFKKNPVSVRAEYDTSTYT